MSLSLVKTVLQRCNVVKTNRLTIPPFCMRSFSLNNDDNSEIGSSTIIVEDGAALQELPVIVRRMKDVVALYDMNCDKHDEKPTETSDDPKNYNLIREEFKSCTNLRDIFKLLSKCERITPHIAIGAVERMCDFEKDKSNSLDNKINFHVNMSKGAIVDKLFKVILHTEDTQIILNTLTSVTSLSKAYKDKLFDELLIRVIDNKLCIDQLCNFARYLHENKENPKYADYINKLWTGFAEREKEINENNINNMFSIIPYLKSSRLTVLNMLEQKLINIWWKLNTNQMENILNILARMKYTSHRSLYVITRWVNTNIHVLKEDELLNIVTKFTELDYHDNQLEKALERYIKVKGIKIESYTLLAAVLNHCKHFRIKNYHILNGCAEFFAANSSEIPSIFIKAFIYPLGYLYFHPVNGVNFWTALEKAFDEKFNKLQTEDILDIMLSCIYLERYPLNFIDRVFNPSFLFKINNNPKADAMRTKLNLIDTAMSLESKLYKGPLLPKDLCAKSVPQDGRIRRLTNSLGSLLEKVSGGIDCYSTNVLVPHVFSNELYLIDIFLHPKHLGSSILNMNMKVDRNVSTAVIIHLPEHYCGNSYIGPQIMRRKHIRLFGMKLATLDFKMVSKLLLHPKELELYFRDALKNTEPSLNVSKI